MHVRRRLLYVLLAALVPIVTLAAVAGPAGATHSIGFHWPRNENPFTVRYGDNVSTAWDAHLRSAAEEWSESRVLRARVVRGTTDPSTCDFVMGGVEVCSAAYGDNSILFITFVLLSGDHILGAAIMLNETYLNSPPYTTRVWRRHILCQTTGFTIGLDLQDLDVSNPNLGTCMDHTNDPGLRPRNTEPNRHDYAMLAEIYAHLDPDANAAVAAAGLAAAGGSGAAATQDAGALVAGSPDGRTSVYAKDLGNGVTALQLVSRAT